MQQNPMRSWILAGPKLLLDYFYRDRPSVVANMSARVGSIGDNQLGGWYSYRASKTALNQLTKTMAIECSRRKTNVACILLHPGTVDTDLSAPFQKVTLPCFVKVGQG